MDMVNPIVSLLQQTGLDAYSTFDALTGTAATGVYPASLDA